MLRVRAGGTNALHAVLMAALVVAAAFVVGYVIFDLEAGVLPSDPPPDASFRFAHDPATDTLVVTHYGGDNLDADRVVVVDQGFEPVGNFSAGANVTAGESTTITDVTEDDTLYVLWVIEDGKYRTLASWNADEIDDADADETDDADAADDETTAAVSDEVVVGGQRTVGAPHVDAIPTRRRSGEPVDRHLFASH